MTTPVVKTTNPSTVKFKKPPKQEMDLQKLLDGYCKRSCPCPAGYCGDCYAGYFVEHLKKIGAKVYV